MFTERDAIQFEMEELKEQARRDFEIYIDSRRHRNERYDQLQNRLREIDMAERQPTRPQPPVQPLSEIIQKIQPETFRKPVVLEPSGADGFTIPQWKEVSETEKKLKEEMKPKNRKKRKYVSTEIVLTKVLEFLIANGKSTLKQIQEYVEAELNTKWTNFNTPMSRVMALTKKIERVDNKYKYVPRED